MGTLAVKESMDKAAGLSRRAIYILLPVVLFLVVVSLSLPAASPPQLTNQKAPPNPADYIGTNACSDCHYAEFLQMQKTPMAAINSDKYPLEQRGCEGCHGPGRAHGETEKINKGDEKLMTEALKEKAASMTAEEKEKQAVAARLAYRITALSPKDSSARCIVCHQKDEKASLFARSRHAGAGVSCVDCHDPHRLNEGEDVAKPFAALESMFSVPKRSEEREWLDNRMLEEQQPELCYDCHQDVRAEFQLPVRHRVNEGLVKCTDCHNPHGSLTPREMNATRTDACTTCHAEKKGPFVYEHGAVRVEGCNGCHTPHGSINLHLLKRRQERQLCLECHTAPQGVNGPHPRLGFQTTGECTRCHIEIHGSNYQMQFLR